jgi:pyruvate-ferredoxin/flavodoxin oxidoreductase
MVYFMSSACSTSHEISKVSVLDQEAYRPLMANVQDAIEHHRQNALNPAHPHQRGTSQGPDIYFQMLEAANKYYLVRAGFYGACWAQ